MIELYVYYKLDSRHTGRLRDAATRLPKMRLLRRVDAGEPATWMEIHSGAQAEADEQAMAQALEGLTHGPRHIERFSAD